MNFRTKLEGRENKWLKIHFMDGSSFTGVLRHVGVDFIEIECYDGDPMNKSSDAFHFSYSRHLVPLPLVKFITVEANYFVEAERKRLEYIASKSKVFEFPETEGV